MIDRQTFYKTFYGSSPPPPPWATDCPIRFEVWLAFGERVQSVDLGVAAAALGTTQASVRRRLPDDFPGARKVGAAWRIPVEELRRHGALVPTGVLTLADLENHPRVDVISAANDDYGGPTWLLDQLRGTAVPRVVEPLSGAANTVGAGSYVAAKITFAELIRTILPLTNLAQKLRSAQKLGLQGLTSALAGGPFNLPATSDEPRSLHASADQDRRRDEDDIARHRERVAHLEWLFKVLISVTGSGPGAIVALANVIINSVASPTIEVPESMATAVLDRRRRRPVLSVTLNRVAFPSVARSRVTIKVDAAEQLFRVDTGTLTWAVVDSGIDRHHPAFWLRDDLGNPVPSPQPPGAPPGPLTTRVVRTFDLVSAREVLAQDMSPTGLIDWFGAVPYVESKPPVLLPGQVAEERNRPWLRPLNPHGTHVAGILAADWREHQLMGICPTLRLFDVRVLDRDGRGDEFSIVAALQLIRHLNEQAGRLLIVGVNLSLAVPHDVANYSTGWTPVCVEADRLTRSGVVVVASAGNAGFEGGATTLGLGYNTASISDPGNTDSIITVGSTHRSDPHRHGVSYFSSRGPTADGRLKPDLLAPGEDIDGPVPDGGLQAMHGTSQAAAHVSGAAAMLMARYRELIGRPERIKEILCATATDLGRERTFQGHGIVDVLRAMQSI